MMKLGTLQATRKLRLGFVLLALVFLAGCSTRFFYERIDWIIVWRVGGYVTLTNEQKVTLKTEVQEHLDYVRVNQLPQASATLTSVARDVEAGYITPDMVEARYDEMLAQLDEFMLGIVPISQRFLQSLSDEQVAELFENLEEINEEMYEEYSGRTPEEREENRNKSAIKSTEEWTGNLSDAQKALLADALARMDDASEQWIDYQREWQRRFRTLIETRPPDAEYRDELTLLFVYPRSFHSEEYRRKVDGNRQIFNVALAELLTGLTDKQRKRMVGKLDNYAEDLLLLAEYE